MGQWVYFFSHRLQDRKERNPPSRGDLGGCPLADLVRDFPVLRPFYQLILEKSQKLILDFIKF